MGGFSSHGADDTPPVKLILPTSYQLYTTRIQRKYKHDCNGKFYPIGIKTGFGGYTGDITRGDAGWLFPIVFWG